MPLTLATFKRDIPAAILGRGRRYYADGHVVGLDELDANRWQAEVVGTYPYTVTITAAGDALSWTCTCPYDAGPVCKHVAATLYAIEAALDPATAPRPRRKRPTRADRVRAAIETLDHDELVDLLVELAGEDRQIAHTLLARYSPPEGGKPAARRLVTDALRIGGRGFLDYRGAMEAARSVSRLLDRAANLLAAGQPDEALMLYQAVLEEVVPALQGADDSAGMLGDCAGYALEGLGTVAGRLSPGGRAALFDYCVSDDMADRLAGWDWGWDLLQLGGTLLTTPGQRAALFAALDRVASRNEDTSWSGEYDRARAAEIKLDIIEQQDSEAAVLAFLQAHVELESLRFRLVEFYLQRGDLDAARRTCQDWLNGPPNTHRGTRIKFLAILLTIAEQTGDTAEQTRLLRELFLMTGDMTAYRRLKALVGPAAWPDYRPELLARVADEGGRSLNLGAIYAEEALWPELMALVRQWPSQATVWHRQLAPLYPQELSAIYAQQAAKAIAHSPTRAQYEAACALLLAMREVDPAGAAAVVARWRVEHKRRPALQDELTKAFGPPAGSWER